MKTVSETIKRKQNRKDTMQLRWPERSFVRSEERWILRKDERTIFPHNGDISQDEQIEEGYLKS